MTKSGYNRQQIDDLRSELSTSVAQAMKESDIYDSDITLNPVSMNREYIDRQRFSRDNMSRKSMRSSKSVGRNVSFKNEKEKPTPKRRSMQAAFRRSSAKKPSSSYVESIAHLKTGAKRKDGVRDGFQV